MPRGNNLTLSINWGYLHLLFLGKFTNHKGRNRRFTNPEELEEERKKDELKRQWRKQQGDDSTDESADEKDGSSKISEESDSDSEENDEEVFHDCDLLIGSFCCLIFLSLFVILDCIFRTIITEKQATDIVIAQV